MHGLRHGVPCRAGSIAGLRGLGALHRCNGVFDATEVLFDIDSGAAVKLQHGAAGLHEPAIEAPVASENAATDWSAVARTDAASTGPGLVWGGGDVAHSPVDPLFAEPHHTAHQTAHHTADPTAHIDGEAWTLPPHDEPQLRAPSRGHDDALERIVITDHVPSELLALESDLLASAPGAELAAAAVAVAADNAKPQRIDPSLSTDVSVQTTPAFLRRAAGRSSGPGALQRAALWLAALTLTLAALLQGALLWRDALAAAWPTAKPAMQSLCRVAGCSVLPLRRLEFLSVESSTLSRLDGSTLYRLQLVLRNQGATVVMMPSMELTLNDGQGQLVARRVMAAAELGLPQTALAPGQSLPVLALLSTGERRVDGYSLELFYP